MHRLHHGENDRPVGFPCGSTVNVCSFFHCQRNVFQIAAVQHDVHGHIEYQVQNDNAQTVVQSHNGGLLDQRHHQNGKGNEHTADDVKVDQLIALFPCHVSANGIACHRVEQHCQHNGHCGNQKAVAQRVPEVCHTHCLGEVAEIPCAGERECSGNVICHFGRALECDYDGHVQREQYRQAAQKQQYGQKYIGTADFMCLFHSCSSFLPVIFI